MKITLRELCALLPLDAVLDVEMTVRLGGGVIAVNESQIDRRRRLGRLRQRRYRERSAPYAYEPAPGWFHDAADAASVLDGARGGEAQRRALELLSTLGDGFIARLGAAIEGDQQCRSDIAASGSARAVLSAIAAIDVRNEP